MPLAAALRSMAESNAGGAPLEVVILTSAFSPAMRTKVESSLPPKSISIRWVEIDLHSFQTFSTRSYISKITFARLLLSSYLSDQVKKVLYLDGDLLVLGNLQEAWELDLGGAPVAAVMDTESIDHCSRLDSLLELQNAQFSASNNRTLGEYFNAGVLLIDMARWREEQVSEKALRFMADNPDTPLADQDALNVACAAKWKKLDARWNCQTHDPRGYSAVAPEQRPAIVHFAGKWKPWSATTLSPDSGFYNDFRKRTKFARTPVQRALYSVIHGFTLLRSYVRQFKTLHATYRFLKMQALNRMAVMSRKRALRYGNDINCK